MKTGRHELHKRIYFLMAAGAYWAIGIGVATNAATGSPVLPAPYEAMIPWAICNILSALIAFVACGFFSEFIVKPLSIPVAGLAFVAVSFLQNSIGDSPLLLLALSIKSATYIMFLMSLAPYLGTIATRYERILALSQSSVVAFLLLLAIGYMPFNSTSDSTAMLGALCTAFSCLLIKLMKHEPNAEPSMSIKPMGCNEKPAAASDKYPPMLCLTLFGYGALAIPLSFFVGYNYSTELTVDWSLIFLLASGFSLGAWILNAGLARLCPWSSTYSFVSVLVLFAGILILCIFGGNLFAGSLIYAGAYLVRSYMLGNIGPDNRLLTIEDSVRLITAANIPIAIGGSIGLFLAFFTVSLSGSTLSYSFFIITCLVFIGGFVLTNHLDSMRLMAHEPGNAIPDNGIADCSHIDTEANPVIYLTGRCHNIAKQYQLSTRESEIVQLLLMGRGVNAIADELCLSPNTVKSHMNRIYKKLRVHSREELCRLIIG